MTRFIKTGRIRAPNVMLTAAVALAFCLTAAASHADVTMDLASEVFNPTNWSTTIQDGSAGTVSSAPGLLDVTWHVTSTQIDITLVNSSKSPWSVGQLGFVVDSGVKTTFASSSLTGVKNTTFTSTQFGTLDWLSGSGGGNFNLKAGQTATIVLNYTGTGTHPDLGIGVDPNITALGNIHSIAYFYGGNTVKGYTASFYGAGGVVVTPEGGSLVLLAAGMLPLFVGFRVKRRRPFT